MTARFRVWDGEHMWMPSEANDDVARFGLERDGTLYFERDGELVETADGYEVLHYTGLNDSEGTPIYEGDILEDVRHGTVDGTVKIRMVAEWNNEVSAYTLNGTDSVTPLGMELGDWLVIGNRFEDAELLKEPLEAR
jgi:flagellar basal body rod protein FlgG